MRNGVLGALSLVLLAVPVACSGDGGVETATTRQAVENSAEREQIQLSFELPVDAQLNKVVLGALSPLTITDRVQIGGDVFTTTGDTTLGVEAKVASTFVNGTLTLRDRARVQGNAIAKLVSAPPSSIGGTTTLKDPMPSPVTVAWTVSAEKTSHGDVPLEVDQRRDLAPGRYGKLTLKSRAIATLHSGVYRISEFSAEPQSKLLIDDSRGPVQIVVDGNFVHRGAVTAADNSVPEVLFAVRGTSVLVEAPFTGVIVAPLATVQLQAARPRGHRAFIVGKNLLLEADTKVQRLPFDWTTVVGVDFDPIPADAVPRDLLEDELDLTVDIHGDGSGNATASGTSGDPRHFSVDDDFTLDGGIIGNGTVTFRFRLGSGTWTTCTYRGQSSTAQPNTAAELLKGTRLVLVSCSDGQPAGIVRTADQFELSVTPSPGLPVTVSAPMIEPRVCDDNLEMLSPDQTRVMREGFNWNTAQKVGETTPDGRPTVYYAWVYVRNKDEALALKKLYIHALNKPLFDAELKQFAGQCGVFTNPGDGSGSFIPVVIPGKTYNKLIDALHSDDIEGDRTIFDAVIIRNDVPAAAKNANGSIKLDVLGQAGFRYLDYEVNPFTDPGSIVLDSGASRVLVGALEWTAQAARDASEIVTGIINEIDQLFRGEVSLTFHMQTVTRDSLFGNQPMVRGWGPYAGKNLAAEGMQVKVLQRLFDLPIPSTAKDDVNINGVAKIDATDGASSRGSGLCVELRTPSALITDFLWAEELCDLRGYIAPDEMPTGGYGNPETSDYALNFDSSKTTYVLNVDSTRVIGLVQADDAYQYVKHVMGFEAPRARILTGFWATTFSQTNDDGKKKLFAPCLNYPNSMTSAIVAASGGTGALVGGVVGSIFPGIGSAAGAAVGSIAMSTFASVVGNSDIVMSTKSKLRHSRAIMSHEYGHYEFCSMAYQANEEAVDHIVWGTTINGNELNYPLRYTNEAIADFIMGQVAGASDYGWMAGLDSSAGDTYCDSAMATCWDQNLTGEASNADGSSANTTDPGKRNIGRVASLLQDLFDGQSGARTDYQPTNGDSWVWQATGNARLVYETTGYGNQDGTLERVALRGAAFRSIVEKVAAGMEPFIQYSFDDAEFQAAGYAIDIPKLWGAMDSTMRAEEVSWCDRCRVFALHEPGANIADVQSLFQTCLNAPELGAVLGPSPDPDLRLRASDCEVCPAGMTSDANGECQPCIGEIVGNVCAQCVADVVVDAATMPMPWVQSFDVTVPTAGDNCPNTFWVEVTNPGAVFTAGADSFTVSLATTVNDEATCERPWSLTTAFPDTSTGYFTETRIDGVGHYSNDCNPFCLETCLGLPERSVLPAETTGSLMRFGTAVQNGAALDILVYKSGPPPG